MRDRYDPKLPILAELEEEVRRAAELRLDGHSRQRRRLREAPRGANSARTGRRILRRALVLAALALLIGATALAATGVLEGGGNDPAVVGRALELEHGPADGGYRFLAHRDRHALCRVLIVAAGVTSRCQARPRGDDVQSLSAVGGGRRFVFGLAGPRRQTVAIRVGSRRLSVPTRPLDRGAALVAGIDPRLRFFLVSFPTRPGSRSQPPAVVDGRIDCSLTMAFRGLCAAP